jgi:isopentenyldiphosphate isomerase
MAVTNYNPRNTDRKNEFLCEVDENDNLIGPVTREECHNETRKPWHRSTHAYLLDQNGDLFLSQRSFSKDTAAGMWTISAGGHVKFGDTPEATINKELEEELGIKTNLELIDKLIIDYGSEKEILYIFAGTTGDKLRFNPNEINQIKLFNFDTITNNFISGKFDLSGGSRDTFKHILKTGTLAKFRQKILLHSSNVQ